MALSGLVELLTPPRNSSHLYESALDKVLEVLKLEHGALRVLDPQTGQLELVSCKGFPDEYRHRFRKVKIGERSSGKVFLRKGPVLWENIQADPSCSHLFLRGSGIQSILAVPLLAREGVVGTLGVASPERARFKEHEVRLLSAMGKVIGIAIENASLFSSLRRSVDDLTKLTLRLEESDEIKDRLLSVISHELRTPVTIILGHVEILMDGIFGDMSEQQRESLLKIRRSGAGLLFQVENAIDVSELELGGATVHPEHFAIEFVRESVMELLADAAKQKGLEVRWEIAPGVPRLFTDSVRLVKIFRNLVDNAIKFTEKGYIRVRVSYSSERDRMECEVEDTGIGIPPKKFDAIFEPFLQMDNSHTRLYGGMGLGLRNVKKTLELLGGGIEVRSSVGKGSVFRFWFPARFGRGS